jgi:hypothetical protein
MRLLALAILLLVWQLPQAATVHGQTMDNLFFLHHSTGRNIIDEGDVRGHIDAYNVQQGTSYRFWDHDYNSIGLRDPDGVYLGYDYDIPGDNTDPDGLWYLWTTPCPARAAILANHEVIAFKSCFPASHIPDMFEFRQRVNWYLDMRTVFDQYPDRLFVVMSQPPLHRLATDLTEADYARAFADWLKSPAYLGGHDNVVCFDLFDLLAHPDDGSPSRNMLRYEYERSHTGDDSHPNELANQTVGPLLAGFLIQVTLAISDAGPPAAPVQLAQNAPNPFNPLTTIAFDLPAPAPVRLQVFDLQGRLVATLVDGPRQAGRSAIRWDGRDRRGGAVAGGIYLYRLETPDAVLSRTMTLVR